MHENLSLYNLLIESSKIVLFKNLDLYEKNLKGELKDEDKEVYDDGGALKGGWVVAAEKPYEGNEEKTKEELFNDEIKRDTKALYVMHIIQQPE
jgi:hypothetical protein